MEISGWALAGIISLSLILLILLLLTCIHCLEKKTKFIFKESAFHQKMKEEFLEEPYNPTFYLPTAWLKLWAGLRQKVKKLEDFERDVFTFPDGGQVALDWYPAKLEDSCAPVIIVVPGLNGETKDGYVSYTCREAFLKNGFRSVVYNRRGYCGMPLTGKYVFSWTVFEDMDRIVEHIRSKYPQAPIYALGFSMGANYLQRYCGEKGKAGEPSPFEAVVTVSCPNNLKLGSHKIEKSWIVNKVLCKACCDIILANKEAPLMVEIFNRLSMTEEKMRAIKSIREFDDVFTCKALNLERNDDYYDSISGVYLLEYVKTPMCSFSSVDDPLLEIGGLDEQKTRENENIFQVVVNNGGHVEYSHGCGVDNWAVLSGLKYLQRVRQGRHKQ